MGFVFATLSPQKFLDQLVEKELIGQAAARRALEATEEAGTSIERTLLELGLVPEDTLFRALAEHLDLAFIEYEEIDLDLVRSLGLPLEFLGRAEAVPVRRDEDEIWIATSDPQGADSLRSIGFSLDVRVRAAITAPSSIKAALGAQVLPVIDASQAGTSGTDIERLRAMTNDGPIIRLVNDLIGKAAMAGASDIHLEAEEHGARVRFRIDGALRTEQMIAEADRASVVSRLKVMANLNISEKRRPQDGRAQISVRGRTVDIRLSTLPTQYGESVVLRLLDRNRMRLDWAALGFPPDRVTEINRIVQAPNGIFLVAGPTGSGKTTTLYTALTGINTDDRKILTVEDPIEYALAGVNQVQVEPGIEMTFARALRAILRQDPDVIMVGEIRDQETAEIAVRAALVGRLVLSTIHTNDSLSAIDRLIDLGVPRYLLGATLRGILSQRLVRRVCQACSGAGCDDCAGAGYRGRMVIEELLPVTPDVAVAIAAREGAGPLGEAARAAGFESFAVRGPRLVEAGQISQSDLERVLGASWLD
jgi:general secretion pathway protein E